MRIVDKRGYVKVKHEGEMVWEHRLVWFKKHGTWPEVVDHIDHNPSNNDISNLRNVSKGDNNHLRPVLKTSCTGVKGVHPNNKSGYFARIKRKGKSYYLGNYKTVEEAKEAYDRACVELYHEYY